MNRQYHYQINIILQPAEKSRSQCLTPFMFLCVCHLSDGEGGEEESSQQPQHVASVLVNSSPKMPRVEVPNAVQSLQSSRPESFDVTLQRKDNEGFGFVILTSKNKPPPGGQE